LGYIALTAFAINVIIAALLTLVFRAAKTPYGHDETIPADYFADAGDPRVKKLPATPATVAAGEEDSTTVRL
jgi:SSS family solute:Na+ symporter